MSIYSPYEVDFKELLSSEKTWNVFANKFIKLPFAVKDIIVSRTTADYLKILYSRIGLDQNQSADLSRIIRDVLLTDIFLGDFPTLISQKLNIETKTASQIVQRVVNELFAPAIEDIKKMQREKFEDRITQIRSGQIRQSPTPQQPLIPAQSRRPTGLVRPSEIVQEGNVINLRDRENQQ